MHVPIADAGSTPTEIAVEPAPTPTPQADPLDGGTSRSSLDPEALELQDADGTVVVALDYGHPLPTQSPC